jgi:hypothetical protein
VWKGEMKLSKVVSLEDYKHEKELDEFCKLLDAFTATGDVSLLYKAKEKLESEGGE